MFGIFGNDNAEPSVDEATRLWMEEMFLWLIETFGKEQIKTRAVLYPVPEDFPVKYDGSYEAAVETMYIVAVNMDVDPDLIVLELFEKDDDTQAGGLYKGQHEGKYRIAIEVGMLDKPMDMVAVLAHEIAHIKLLGEGRIEENNEHLTDLTTIIFGFGIFNANCAFQFSTDSRYKRWSNLGYLSQMEWGYALALYAYIRRESNPEWVKHLNKNVKGDFIKSIRFISDNQDQVMKKKS